jgi:PKD repeat protein
MIKTILLALLPLAPLCAQTLTTSTAGNTTLNGFAGANSMFVDVTVLSPAGILVNQLDVNVLGGTGTVDVYVTAVGNSFLPVVNLFSAWTRVGTAPVTSSGTGMQIGPMAQPFFLAPGLYGMAIHYVNLQTRYTNPTTTTPPGPTMFANADLQVDCINSRVRNCTTTDPCTGGSSATPRVPNLVFHYTSSPQVVDFSATPVRGATPLAVQFTDRSASTLPGGILAWAWDFDGDSVIDSSLQNPLHTYATCGDFTVSLTIVDASGPHILTRTNLVQTDLIVPAFTSQLVGANAVQFTDTSSPVPQTWSWDLDGDNVPDSTLQNPLFVYPATTTEVTVTLTVSRACRAPVTLTRRIAVASALETRFDGNTVTTATATGGANFFDVTVTNPGGIVVRSMHVNSSVPATSPVTINVHLTPVSYVGNHTVPGLWRQVATATATSRGTGQRTFVQFPGGFYLPPGSYGMAVEQVGASPVYSNAGGNQTFANADLSLTAGLTMEAPVFTTGTVFTPRIWNGAIYYTTCTAVADAGYSFFGAGCAGPLGIPGNTATSLPRINTTMTATLTNLPLGAAIYILGFSRTTSAFGPLPLDLAPFGAPGCLAMVRPDANLLIAGPGTSASFNLTLPNNPGLLCTTFFAQGLALGAANPLGAVTSDAAAGIIGL